MRYVVAVAETLNFTRAAERCMVVQSALSHQMARLERELGTRLFERTSKRVQLTPAGRAFLPAARECLEAAGRASAHVAAAIGEVRGRLGVGLIPTVAAVDIPAALRTFRHRHPQVRIGLRVGASDDLVEQVREGSLEVAFLGTPTTFSPKGVSSQKLAENRLVVVVSPSHPLAGESTIALAQLAGETFIELPAGTAGRVQSDQAFIAAGIVRDIAFEVTTAEFMARLVAEGLGIAMMPPTYVPHLTGVTAIEVNGAPMRAEHVIWRSTGCTPAASAFLSLLGIPHRLGPEL